MPPPLQPVWVNASAAGGGGAASPPPPPPAPPPSPAKKPAVTTGLGPDVDKIANQSPTLQDNVKKLQDDGWTIKYGEPGSGSASYKEADNGIEAKTIIIDPSQKGNPEEITQTLAHESGHALYTPDPYVPPDGLTRAEYVEKNTMRDLKDEGEATMTNALIRDEIKKNGGPDIGIAGAQAKKYEEIAKKYPDAADRDKAREEIGKIFAKGENPSGDDVAGMNYEDYYSKTYKDYWDENVAKK